jgi:hypothetical protein
MPIQFVHKRQQMIFASFLMLVSIAPIPIIRMPIVAILAWSLGWEYLNRRFLYKLMFIYATIFVLVGFPLELAILETIDSVLIEPLVIGNYPMILTWMLWILFFSMSIFTQFLIMTFCSYIVWHLTGKWVRRLPNYISEIKKK